MLTNPPAMPAIPDLVHGSPTITGTYGQGGSISCDAGTWTGATSYEFSIWKDDGDGLRNVFMVLEGPQARALAASGAFGELDRSPHLRPVFESVEDAEGARRVLGSGPVLPYAA